MLYAQLLAFPVLATGGWWAGKWLGRQRFWWAGVSVALGVIAIVIVGNRVARMSVLPPFCRAVDGDVNPFLMTAVVAVLSGILIPRLPTGRSGRAGGADRHGGDDFLLRDASGGSGARGAIGAGTCDHASGPEWRLFANDWLYVWSGGGGHLP